MLYYTREGGEILFRMTYMLKGDLYPQQHSLNNIVRITTSVNKSGYEVYRIRFVDYHGTIHDGTFRKSKINITSITEMNKKGV